MKKVWVIIFCCFSILYAQCPSDWHEPDYIKSILIAAGDEAGLPVGLPHCVSYKESRFKPSATSCVVNGYRSCGLMQLYRKYIVATATQYHDGGYSTFNWQDPADNAQVGCRYLAYLIDKFGGSVYLGVLAYNWGETNVRNMKSLDDVPVSCKDYTDSMMILLDAYSEDW